MDLLSHVDHERRGDEESWHLHSRPSREDYLSEGRSLSGLPKKVTGSKVVGNSSPSVIILKLKGEIVRLSFRTEA